MLPVGDEGGGGIASSRIGLGLWGRKFKGRTDKKDGVSYANVLTPQNSVRPVRHWEVMPIPSDHGGNGNSGPR